MVRVVVGDLFASTAQTLVNTVNCVGVMGKGIALEFKNRFPEMYEDYVRRCDAKEVALGEPYLYQNPEPPWILNFPTKGHWRGVSRLSDIVAGLKYLEQRYQEWGITSLAVPPLGCGHGGLEWRVVGPTLYRHLSRLNIPVELYPPADTLEPQLQTDFLANETSDSPANNGSSRVDPSSIALVDIVARIDRERYHWPVGRTTLQKIAYFATEAGLPTGLTHQRGSYGPFAPDLKARITRLVNHGLIQEKELGRMFAIVPGPTFADAVKSYQSEIAQWEPILARVCDLFLRIHTHQAEAAATVHFSAKVLEQQSGKKPSEMDVLEAVKHWKQKRKPPLQEAEVASAIRNLNLLGWIDILPSQELPVPPGVIPD